MPPVARKTCRLEGCNNPRHVYPGGSKSSYCSKHNYLRRAKIRDGLDSMTGQMAEILLYLKNAKESGVEFSPLEYPFAHGVAINNLIERDWIFGSRSAFDNSVLYKITGRGLKALKVYLPRRNRNDGMCTRCGVRPRQTRSSGKLDNYCAECESVRNAQRRKNGTADGDPNRCCSRCGVRPRHQYPGGRLSSYCTECENARCRERNRRQRQQLLKDIRSGGPVPLCKVCNQRPRRVSANSVSNWCKVCGPEQIRKSKLRRVLREKINEN